MTGPGSNVKRPNKTECQQGFLRSDRHHCKRIRKLNQRSELSNQETYKRVGHALCDGSVSKAKARKMHSTARMPLCPDAVEASAFIVCVCVGEGVWVFFAEQPIFLLADM